MALAPFRRPFASDIWDPLGSTVFDPFASTSLMGMTDPTFTSSQAINRLSPLLAADLIETPTDFHVHIDLPGCTPEDIQVTVDRGFLELKAERKEVHRETGAFSRRIERSFGRVSRRIALPSNADEKSADCSFKNGVLTVSFKKLEGEASGRRQLLIK